MHIHCICVLGYEMSKGKSEAKKKKKKSSQLVIRIEESERNAFVKLCDRLDTSAAREIRRFMRDWVAKHAAASEAVAPVEAEAEVAPESPAPEAAAETTTKPVRRKRKETEAPAD